MNSVITPTCAALVTPRGRGAVSSIVVAGPLAVFTVESLFRSAGGKSLARQALDRILYGTWANTGEEVVVARRGPSRVEIHCHGGAAAPAAILSSLATAGCSIVAWQEVIAAQEQSVIHAQARIALADCHTERTATILLDQYRGALELALDRIIRRLTENDATIIAPLRELASWADFGVHLTTPWRVVIAGPPNAGKSTLINALVGYERSIVFDQPGTTRDVVTAPAAIDGWPLELCDTAGLRAGAEPLERSGVRRAEAALQSADLAILVFDMAQPWTPEMAARAADLPHALVVYNKADLCDGVPHAHRPVPGRPEGILISAKTGWNLPALVAGISARLVPRVPPPGAAVPFTHEQAQAVRAALSLADARQFDQAASVLARLVAGQHHE